MKPIAIFRHTESEEPAYFATFLEQHSIPWQLIAIDQGKTVPEHVEDFSGICLMGGAMSVNDPLPWVTQTCALIREAVSKDIPVIGHCLGGQLMSKALGGNITRNPIKEIGWGSICATDNDSARHWLGDRLEESGGLAEVFQWHGETFDLPPGTQLLFSNEYCTHQAFTLGSHLAMQFHVEMTLEMIRAWCQCWQTEVEGITPLPSTIQPPHQILAEAPARLLAMRKLADQLYSVWIRGLKH